MHEDLRLHLLARLTVRTSGHYVPDPPYRPKEFVHGILQRHLLPSQNQDNHYRPRQHPHAREIRRLHPKPLPHFRSVQLLLQPANKRFVFFSIIALPYSSRGGNATAAVNLMSLPSRDWGQAVFDERNKFAGE
jgi:hypothetical protein